MYIEWSYQIGAIAKGCLLTGFFFIATEIMNNGWLFCWGNTRRCQFLISALWWQPMPTSRSQEIISILFVQNPHLWKQATKNLAICWFNSQRVIFKKPFLFCHTYIPLNHVQEEFTSASQINQFLVAKPPEILPVCAPVFPAQTERPRTEFGGKETSCYQSPKQPKNLRFFGQFYIYNIIIYMYIYI